MFPKSSSRSFSAASLWAGSRWDCAGRAQSVSRHRVIRTESELSEWPWESRTVVIMCHIHKNICRTRRSRASSVSPTSSVSSSPKSASPTFDEQYYPARKPYRLDFVSFKPFYWQLVNFRMASSFELSSDQPALYYQRARKLTGIYIIIRLSKSKILLKGDKRKYQLHAYSHCSQFIPESFRWTDRETSTPVQESFQIHTTRTEIKKTETTGRLALRVIFAL